MLLLIFLPTGGPPTTVIRPGFGDLVERPADPSNPVVPRPASGTVPRPADPVTVTVARPGNGDIVERPDAATGAIPWTR